MSEQNEQDPGYSFSKTQRTAPRCSAGDVVELLE